MMAAMGEVGVLDATNFEMTCTSEQSLKPATPKNGCLLKLIGITVVGATACLAAYVVFCSSRSVCSTSGGSSDLWGGRRASASARPDPMTVKLTTKGLQNLRIPDDTAEEEFQKELDKGGIEDKVGKFLSDVAGIMGKPKKDQALYFFEFPQGSRNNPDFSKSFGGKWCGGNHQYWLQDMESQQIWSTFAATAPKSRQITSHLLRADKQKYENSLEYKDRPTSMMISVIDATDGKVPEVGSAEFEGRKKVFLDMHTMNVRFVEIIRNTGQGSFEGPRYQGKVSS